MGRRVTAHAHGVGGLNAALRAGVDSIEHGTYLDNDSIRLLRQGNRYLVPTLEAGWWVAQLAERGGVLTPAQAQTRGLQVNQDGVRRDALQLLAYPSITFEQLAAMWPELNALSPPVREQLEIDALYSGYLERQAHDVEAFKRDEDLRLDPALDYARVGGLSNEVREKLAHARPVTLGQASRIEGVTPGALTALLAHVKREQRKRA